MPQHIQPRHAGRCVMARALVLRAERYRQCETLHCQRNAPAQDALSEANQQKLQGAVQAAERLANAMEVKRWRARGDAAFAPSAQSARALAAMPPTPGDTAALISVLRRINNLPAAVQLSRRYPQDPNVLLELAICHLMEPSADALAVGERMVELQPGNPLAYAVLAMLSARAGENNQALDAYEKALKIWDNEPDWHDAAGDIYLQVGLNTKGVEHRRKALLLEPNRAHFAYKLGEVCLAEENIPEAVEYLERATMLQPHQADAWLALATAYHLAKRLPQALDAARQASTLDPSSAESLLVAGETALSMGDATLALDFGQNAVRRVPENPAASLFLVRTLVLLERQAEALALLNQAPPAVMECYPAAFERARLIYQVHGAKPALEVLEKMVKEHPEEPGLLSFLAQVQAECGEVKSAERYGFKALRLDPSPARTDSDAGPLAAQERPVGSGRSFADRSDQYGSRQPGYLSRAWICVPGAEGISASLANLSSGDESSPRGSPGVLSERADLTR
jgi:tetratricopeptide (TPR) repeat protein